MLVLVEMVLLGAEVMVWEAGVGVGRRGRGASG